MPILQAWLPQPAIARPHSRPMRISAATEPAGRTDQGASQAWRFHRPAVVTCRSHLHLLFRAAGGPFTAAGLYEIAVAHARRYRALPTESRLACVHGSSDRTATAIVTDCRGCLGGGHQLLRYRPAQIRHQGVADRKQRMEPRSAGGGRGCGSSLQLLGRHATIAQ